MKNLPFNSTLISAFHKRFRPLHKPGIYILCVHRRGQKAFKPNSRFGFSTKSHDATSSARAMLMGVKDVQRTDVIEPSAIVGHLPLPCFLDFTPI
jgi:hypothetical protein